MNKVYLKSIKEGLKKTPDEREKLISYDIDSKVKSIFLIFFIFILPMTISIGKLFFKKDYTIKATNLYGYIQLFYGLYLYLSAIMYIGKNIINKKSLVDIFCGSALVPMSLALILLNMDNISTTHYIFCFTLYPINLFLILGLVYKISVKYEEDEEE